MEKKIIAIGALGGSGTRVVAKLFQELGFFIGDELNQALDNLTYTVLFKDKDLFSNKELLKKRMIVFDKYMSNEKLSGDDICIYNKSKGNRFLSLKRRNLMKFKFRFRNLAKRELKHEYTFKEPNSIHFLEEYLNAFQNSKYVYVMRHGLDMAFSSNKGQLANFGNFYGLENNVVNANDNSEIATKLQLNYWVLITKKVNQLKEKYKGRIHIINHSSLCENPVLEINKLINFLNLNVLESEINRLSAIPNMPSSSGRYLKEDLTKFDKDQILYVKSQGFRVELNNR